MIPDVPRDVAESEAVAQWMQAKEALRTREANYGVLFEHVPDGVAITDPEGCYLEANRSLCRMLGYTRAELIELRISDVVPPSEIQQITPAINLVLAGSEYHREWQLQRKDGSVFAADVTATLMPDGNLLGIIRDITERKRVDGELSSAEQQLRALVAQLLATEQRLQELTGNAVDAVIQPGGQSYLLQEAQAKLRQSEARFREMFTAAATGIAISTPHGRFLQVNAAYCQMLGYTEEELLTRDFVSLTHPDDLVLNLKLRDELLAGQRENFVMEKRYLKKNGDIVWTRHSVSATRADGGEIVTLVVIAEDISERKRGQEALMLFRTLIDQTTDAIEVIDAETRRYLDVNESACVSLGYSRAELLALSVFDIDPDLSPAFRQRIDRELKTTGSIIFESHHRRKDRSSFPVEVNLKRVKLDKDYIVAVVRNITARRKAEDALRESEERYRALIDWSPEAITVQRDGKLLYVNPASVKLAGVTSAQDMVGRSILDFVAPESRQVFLERMKSSSAQGGDVPRIEGKLIRPDGTAVDVEVQDTSITYDGKPALYSSMRDITERRRIEARFRRLVDSNAQGVFFWNTRGEITEANDALLSLVRYTREELEAGRMSWMKLTPPEYSHLDERALQECSAKGVCTPYEKEWVRRDGSRVPILLGAAMFADNPDDGVCFVLDLTERKKLERQFLRAQRMESIGTLAGGIAHDLNNILSPIMLSIEMLKTMSDTPQARKMLATIEVSTRRGADIVRQVLSFARGLDCNRIEVQPKHLLNDLETIIRNTFPKDIQLVFVMPGDTRTILGDPTQIHQVLLNLCVNARDAMPKGGSLTVSAENCTLDEHYAGMNLQAKAGRYVIISVTDTGLGIRPEILDKIFEPFFTTKDMNKGSGLGLSTVMAIVKSHGGIVTVYSEPGKGTTFKVYLPAMESVSEGRMSLPETEILPRGHGERVLVVDDEDSIRTITSQTLQAFGYRVLTAENGADAVATYAVNKHDIAVVITDMMMPIMGGSAVIRALKQINPAVKIIASSGLSVAGAAAEEYDARGKKFLVKPYTATTLLNTVRAILDET